MGRSATALHHPNAWIPAGPSYLLRGILSIQTSELVW